MLGRVRDISSWKTRLLQVVKKNPGRETEQKKNAPPGLQNEGAELLTFVQYSPSLHTIEC